VDVAPHPVLAWFERLDHRVLSLVEVFRSVLVFRAVAAAHVATGFTKPEMNPFVACFQAFLAAIRCLRLHVLNRIKMIAVFPHGLKLLQRAFYKSAPMLRLAK
jgi:hypothetical protein